MKRIIRFVLICVSVVTMLFTLAFAVDNIFIRSSEYFRGYRVWTSSNGNGMIEICADIKATGQMTRIGMDEIEIQCLSSGKWRTVDTISGTTRNGMLESNTSSYSGFYEYDGSSGKTYRAIVTVYAKNGSGSDSVPMTTNSVVA